MHVGIAHHVGAARQPIAARLHLKALDVAMLQKVLVGVLDVVRNRIADLVHDRRLVDVIRDGREAAKSLGANDFFGVQLPVGTAKLDVPLLGHLPHARVIWHRCKCGM
jgi:hypothetical protein